MDYKFLPAAAALLMASACGEASAVTVDSANPVHCVAAFQISAAAAKADNDPDWAAEEQARSIFEGAKIGRADAKATKTEIIAVIKQIKDDVDAMRRLYPQCRARQDADPRFVSERALLMALARQD